MHPTCPGKLLDFKHLSLFKWRRTFREQGRPPPTGGATGRLQASPRLPESRPSTPTGGATGRLQASPRLPESRPSTPTGGATGRLQASPRLPESKQADKVDQPSAQLSNRPDTRGQENNSGHWRRRKHTETPVSPARGQSSGPGGSGPAGRPCCPAGRPCCPAGRPYCLAGPCGSPASRGLLLLLRLPLFLEETLTPHSPGGSVGVLPPSG